MANHRKTETAAKLKKFYSTMSNAVKLAETEQGLPVIDWDWQGENQINNLNNIMKNINYTKTEVSEDLHICVNVFYLNDGSVMCTDTIPQSFEGGGFEIHYDINGDKAPNKYGRDQFLFAIIPNNNINAVGAFPCNDIDLNSISSREEIKNICKNNEGYSRDQCCTKLIQLDGWEIKDDYPLKI